MERHFHPDVAYMQLLGLSTVVSGWLMIECTGMAPLAGHGMVTWTVPVK